MTQRDLTEPKAGAAAGAAGGRRERWARAAGCADARLFWRAAAVVAAGMVAFAVIYCLLSWLRYRSYYGGRFDLGNMVQAVYDTAHGHFLEITTADGRQASRLGSHVDPIIALFALPWLVWKSPLMLLYLQAIIVGFSAWPAYRLGVRVLKDPRAAAALAGALLLFPALGYLVLAEFHPVALAVPLLLFAFLYLEEGRVWRALPFLVLAALCKEEIPLLIALMGAFFALRKRVWWPLIITAVAAAYFGVAVGVILPHFNAGGSPFITRYLGYGSGPGQIMKNVIIHPVTTISHLLGGADLRYWLRLLWPFAFLPILAPLALLLTAPELLINGLSTQIWQRSIEFQYVAGEIPFLFVATVLAVARIHGRLAGTAKGGESGRARGALAGIMRRMRPGGREQGAGGGERGLGGRAASGGRRERRRRQRAETAKRAAVAAKAARAGATTAAGPATAAGPWYSRIRLESLALIVLLASLAGNFWLGPLPFSLPSAHFNAGAYKRNSHDAVLDLAVKAIPKGASVSVNNNVGSHLSARRYVYTFPYIDNAAYVIVDETRPFAFDRIDEKLHKEALGKLVIDNKYRSVYARDNVFIFKRADLP